MRRDLRFDGSSRDVVRHEPFLGQILFQHRMPAIDESTELLRRRPAAGNNCRAAPFRRNAPAHRVAPAPRRSAEFPAAPEHFFAHSQEQFVFQLHAALLRAEDFALHLLQLGRDEAFAVGDGLLADIMRRNFVEVGFGDLDVIAEDGIEPNLERTDAGALDFVLLQFGDPIFAARAWRCAIHPAPDRSHRESSRLLSRPAAVHPRSRAQSIRPEPAIR